MTRALFVAAAAGHLCGVLPLSFIIIPALFLGIAAGVRFLIAASQSLSSQPVTGS